MLTFVRSHWEILGYGSDKETGLEWAVTRELIISHRMLSSQSVLTLSLSHREAVR